MYDFDTSKDLFVIFYKETDVDFAERSLTDLINNCVFLVDNFC